MAALTKAKVLRQAFPQGHTARSYNVAASTTIYQGAIVALDGSGNAIPAPVAQNAEYVGIATDTYINDVASPTTDAPLIVRKGQLERMIVSPAPAVTDIGKPIYYTDDGAGTLVAPADLTTRVGSLHKIVSGTDCVVDTNNDWSGA